MLEHWLTNLRRELQRKKEELDQRLLRINENHRRPLESDSKERATQLENQEVVDALGNEARIELHQIASALKRIDDGRFGICEECGDQIARERLLACPHADKCIECASLDDEPRRFAG